MHEAPDFNYCKRSPTSLIGDKLIFQQIDVELLDSFNRSSNTTVFGLFGLTKEGNSVFCNVHGYYPYLYVQLPSHFDENYIRNFIENLRCENDALFTFEIENKMSVIGYDGSGDRSFLKIQTNTFSSLNYIKKAITEKRLIMTGDQLIYETGLPHVVRFMVDAGLYGVNWIEIERSKFEFVEESLSRSSCQIEINVNIKDIISHAPHGEWASLAPLRIMSFDIECAGRRGVFPEASIDPVIQIACVSKRLGDDSWHIKDIFCLGTCAHIPDVNVYSFSEEAELLKCWSMYINAIDPDVMVGYNISNFDFPYLLERAAHLKIKDFAQLGRLKKLLSFSRKSIFSSRAFGTRESKQTNIEGRLQIDMLQVMQREHKLRSYSLNSVSSHFLNEQKEDVPHSIITDLQNGNPESRRRLAQYCLKDAILPMRLMEKLQCLVNNVEMSRVTNVPFNFLLSRGQQIKVMSQLYRRAGQEGFLIPDIKSEGSDEQYEGATVIEPEKGFYDNPIATLDFASLYPSIMIAHNLCYTTLLDKSRCYELKLTHEDLIFTPTGDCFVKPHIRKGLLASILEDLISARKNTKKELAVETDPVKKAVLDGRQLALKISANSVYGFTGATIGKLPCIPISQSVTAFGRKMIEESKKVYLFF